MDEISTSSATRIDEATSRLERQQLKLQEGGSSGVAVGGDSSGGWGEGGEPKEWKTKFDQEQADSGGSPGSAPNDVPPEDSHKEGGGATGTTGATGATGYGPRYEVYAAVFGI